MKHVRVADRAGAYRRRIRLLAPDANTVVGDLEDDFHRFRVTIRHNGAVVASVHGEGLRTPWSTCVEAAVPLRALEGMELSDRVTAVGVRTNPRANCTHMFDLAGLVITHAARGTPRRQYDVEVGPNDSRDVPARLWRDGELALEWQLQGDALVDTPPYSDAPWRGGFMKWADATLDPETAEAAIVMRRACDIGLGRGMDLDACDTAADLGDLMEGVCYSFTRGTMERAARHRLSIIDWQDDPDGLLRDST